MNARKSPTKIYRTTIKDQVYEIIKNMILSGTLQLGEKINVDTLVADLNVSNSPIREALIKLENQGLVENISNVGFKVISFTPESFENITKTLFAIVSGSYDLCIEQKTLDVACQAMREILERQKEALNHEDMNTSTKIALTFDKRIVEATNSERLIALYEKLEDIYFLMALYINQRSIEDHKQNIFEHTRILESIEKRDILTAKHLLYMHYNKHI